MSPETIALLHGPEYAQAQLAEHFTRNVESTSQVTRSRLLTPIALSREGTDDLATPVLTPEQVGGTSSDVREQVRQLREQVATLSEELAAARNESTLSEADVRAIVRDEQGERSE